MKLTENVWQVDILLENGNLQPKNTSFVSHNSFCYHCFFNNSLLFRWILSTKIIEKRTIHIVSVHDDSDKGYTFSESLILVVFDSVFKIKAASFHFSFFRRSFLAIE